MTNGGQLENGGGNRFGWSSPLLWVGVAGIGAFALFTWYLVHQTGDMDVTWNRLFTTYQGIETMAVAIVGALFGTGLQELSPDPPNFTTS
jgi:hypothetical protein